MLVTLHRPSNVDEPETLREILLALNDIVQQVPVIFPVHPRTRQRIVEFGLDNPQRLDGTRHKSETCTEPCPFDKLRTSPELCRLY